MWETFVIAFVIGAGARLGWDFTQTVFDALSAAFTAARGGGRTGRGSEVSTGAEDRP